MALAQTDLFVAYRPANGIHYSVPAAAISGGTSLPDGSGEEIMLKWDGSDWVITDTIDGGVYAS